jgi:hypothetical protein
MRRRINVGHTSPRIWNLTVKGLMGPMGRRLELDAARGFMLVWMVMTHLPTKLPTYVNQPFGFISATEGFIFLSALFTGRIYFRLAQKSGYPAMQRKLGMRTLRLYGYHGLLLAFAFLVAVPVAEHGNRPGLHNLLDYYFYAGAPRAILDSALLVYCPPLLDILPMYIIFLVLTPLVLTITRRIPWKYVIGASFVVWFLAQFGLRQALYNFAVHAFHLRIPLNEMGAFDLWAWQFMWILGLWLGTRWAKGDLPVENWARRFIIPAAFICGALLAFRYVSAALSLDFGRAEPLFDKWHFGVFRLFDFAAVAALLIRFQGALKPLTVRPLILLGQASLQVFCIHLLFCFAGLTIMGPNAMLTDWRQFALLAATLLAMLLTARIFSKSESSRDPGPDVIQLPPALGTSVAAAGVRDERLIREQVTPSAR